MWVCEKMITVQLDEIRYMGKYEEYEAIKYQIPFDKIKTREWYDEFDDCISKAT